MNANASKRRRDCDFPSKVVHCIVGGEKKIRCRNSSPSLEPKRLDSAENITAKGTGMQGRSVSFGSLHVRHYDVEIGNHPSCRNGTPIQLSWKYTQAPMQCLEKYEASRKEEQPRRRFKELLLRSDQREVILKNAGHSDVEIKQAEVIKASKSKQVEQRSDPISWKCRTISDLSCSWSDSMDLQEKTKSITTSSMKNETWDTSASVFQYNTTSTKKKSTKSNKYFQLKRPEIPVGNSNISFSKDNVKKITLLPRNSFSSVSSSSSGSDNKFQKKLCVTSTSSKSSSVSKDQKPTRGYQLVFMPRQIQLSTKKKDAM